MRQRFRFAVQASELGTREALTSAAHKAEDLGYEEFYSYDHVGTADPFIPLLVAAEATSKLRVGPLVLNNELHHPALLARTAATFDRMTDGRLILGIGTGYARSEHEMMDIELRPPIERVARLEETLVALRSLLDSGSVEMTGNHHRLDIAELGVNPLQDHVPFLVGGHSRRVIQVAARHADIFQFTGLTHRQDGVTEAGGFSQDDLTRRVGWLSEAADGRSVERSILVQRVVIADKVGSAVEQACRRLGLDREIIESTPFLMLGSVNQIVDRIQRLREQFGISHVVVREAEDFAPVVAAISGE
jgi:probable F420-dependent oxidoreductase